MPLGPAYPFGQFPPPAPQGTLRAPHRLVRAPLPLSAPLRIGSYVVSTAQASRGELLRVDALVRPASRKSWRGKKCWSHVAGVAAPCGGCPAFAPLRGKRPSPVAVMQSGGAFRLAQAWSVGPRARRVVMAALPEASVSALIAERLRRSASAAGLSAKQGAVLDLVVLGRQTREIATALRISESTVKFHVTNLLYKLDADSRLDLTRRLLFDHDDPGGALPSRRG